MASTRKERRSDARRATADERAFDRPVIERYNSPKTKHTDENAPIVFSAALFVAVFLAVSAVGLAVTGDIDIWIICLAIALAVLAIFTVRIAPQWERIVILRFGTTAAQPVPDSISPSPSSTISPCAPTCASCSPASAPKRR